MSHPVLLSSKHLYLLPIYAKYLFFSPFLEPHCSFLHLRCAQEVDLWGWHQWVLVQLETSEGEGECLPPCKHTGAGTSLTAPPKVINSAGCFLTLVGKVQQLLSSCTRRDSSTSASLQISPPLNTNEMIGC